MYYSESYNSHSTIKKIIVLICALERLLLKITSNMSKHDKISDADPGFPLGGLGPIGGGDWGHGPPTQVLLGENVCENERIGSHRVG